MPGDNPVYEQGSVININELKGTGSSPQTTTAPDQQEFEGLESIVWKRGDLTTPCTYYYGDNDINETDDRYIDDVYMTPFDQQDQQSLPDHEFDNPIYGAETYDS